VSDRTLSNTLSGTLASGSPDESAPGGPARLVVVEGPDIGRFVDVTRGAVQIGTGSDSTLVLTDRTVSRRHSTVRVVPQGFRIEDLASTNGTFYEGSRVTEVVVPLGAVFRTGKTSLALMPKGAPKPMAPSPARRVGDLVAESVAMREIFALLERVSQSRSPVLLEGESGTGKELAARAIHDLSPRKSKGFITVDCGAIPRGLVESELFGHERGAFSGAVQERRGAFERADGGTIFLDEVGELPLEVQPKLLRVLDGREIHRVGGEVAKAYDVRIVAATNRNLFDLVGQGKFRRDLLFRLNGVRIRMPSLRKRPEDVELIAGEILKPYLSAGSKVEGPNLGLLRSYAWPGNVRELRNVLMRAVAMAGGSDVAFVDLQIELGAGGVRQRSTGKGKGGLAGAGLVVDVTLPYKESKRQHDEAFERAYVPTLLEKHNGNLSRAARAAGLSRKHLRALATKLGLRSTEAEAPEDEDDED
jgi:transcriptional regulator with GAF, ATPase, and Fis domain